MHLGFHARLSHDIVDMDECHVLDPAIVALVPKLRALMQSLASIAWADLLVTRTDTGIDLLLTVSAAPDRALPAHSLVRTCAAWSA